MLRILLITLSAVSLGSAAFTFVVILHKAYRNADASLERSASLLLRFIEREYAADSSNFDELVGEQHSGDGGARIRLWDGHGRLLVGDGPAIFAHGHGVPAYQDAQAAGVHWRAYTVWNAAGTLELQVAEPRIDRFQGALQLGWLLLIALGIALPGAGLLVWGAVARAVSPVPLAAAQVAQRGPDDLREIPAEALPQELAPLVTSFNQLLGRLATALQQERLFAANAAHELRTPLAAIRINAQLVQRGTPDVAGPALDKLIAGVDRMTRLLEQLLAFARLESGALARMGSDSFQLSRLVDETLAELEPLGRGRRIRIQRRVDGGSVDAPFQAAHMLLRNLVENALRYAPTGGHVQIVASGAARSWRLEVADEGPGIPPAHRAVLLGEAPPQQRADGTGTGLGLAIVRRLIELLAAEVRLEPGVGGLGTRVIVTVGHAASASDVMPRPESAGSAMIRPGLQKA